MLDADKKKKPCQSKRAGISISILHSRKLEPKVIFWVHSKQQKCPVPSFTISTLLFKKLSLVGLDMVAHL
jgi:hypothetical protein